MADGLAHRYVFVGGLHRSGTSLTARLVAGLPGVGAIRSAPVPENEGVYLQGAIPHTARHGRPMHFATDPDQHLTEGCHLDRLETRLRLEADWSPWFDKGRWRVEKSPVNLTRMRLYQQLFPLSQFVVVMRHPQAVAAAVAKWVDMPTQQMIDHWIDAHRRMADDLAHLHSVIVIRYEDMVIRPDAHRNALAAFLDLDPGDRDEVIRNGNDDYSYGAMTEPQEKALEPWGYGSGGRVMPLRPHVRHPLRQIRQATEAALAE